MAELPSIPLTVPQVSAPRPSVSPSQIAQPYMELANALDKTAGAYDKTSDVLMKDVAQPAAEKAGLQAVTRDAQGNLQVERQPIVGDAAFAYQRAVKMAALADGESVARQDDIALRQQYRDDPQGYLGAAEQYRKDKVDQYTKAAGPEVGIALQRVIGSQTTQTFKGLLNEKERLDLQRAVNSMDAGIASATDDATTLAKAGASPSDPAMQQAFGKIEALMREKAANPRLAYPPEQMAFDLQNIQSQIGANRFVYDVMQTFKNSDPNEAQSKALNAAKDILTNPDYKLNERERQYYFGRAAAEVNLAVQDKNRATYMAQQMQKAKDDAWENAIIKDSATAEPKFSENDIKNSDMSASSKMRMLAWVRRDGAPEPLAQVSHATSMDLFRRINLPDGDPNKISNLGQIRDAFAPSDGSNGQLTRADEEWLEKRFVESRSATGERLTDIRKQFHTAVSPLIDKSNPMMGKIDESGKLQVYQFERFADQKVDEYRASGKNPSDLFDPSKPDYLGKPAIIQQFQKPLQDSIRDTVGRLTGSPPPSPLPPPPEGVRGAANTAVPNPLWGDPSSPTFARDHLTVIQTPSGQSASVNKVAAAPFQGFLAELENSGYKISTVQGYNDRDIAGTSIRSQHAFGNAIDINPNENPVGAFGLPMRTTLPPNVGQIAAKYGIAWGGDWKSKKDPMHFEYVGGGAAAERQNTYLRRPNENIGDYVKRVSGGNG